MPTLALIPIIIFGLIYCKYNQLAKFRIHLYSPQQYIFDILLKGFFVLLSAIGVLFFYKYGFDYSAILNNVPIFIDDMYKEYLSFLNDTNNKPSTTVSSHLFIIDMIFIIGVGCFLSWAIAVLKNLNIAFWAMRRLLRQLNNQNNGSDARRWYKKIKPRLVEDERWVSLSFAFEGDRIKSQLISSAMHKKLVLIDMSNDKVYVGRICGISIPEGSFHSNNYTIIPMKSGYRNEKKEIEFTTHYKNDFLFSTIIKGDNIISVKDYNDDAYEAFPRKHTPFKANKKQRD